jgi:hypothetical protein
VAQVLAHHAPTARTATLPAGWVGTTRSALGAAVGDARWVGGTDGDFVSLNRGRPATGGLDGVCYAVNPQVHASDELSMVETLGGLAATVATARSLFPGLDIVVTPVTLAPRRDGPADPRGASLFGGAWILGVLATLTAAGADSVTVGDPVCEAGTVFPSYHVLADIGDRTGSRPCLVSVEGTRDVAAVGWRSAAGIVLLVANLDVHPVALRFQQGVGPGAAARVLDERDVATARTDPARFRATRMPLAPDGSLPLGAYATARVELPG